MELTELNKLVDRIVEERKYREATIETIRLKRVEFEESIADLTKSVSSIEGLISALQSEVLEALKESGNKSWKTEKATVSRKATVSYKVADKSKVLDWLLHKGLTEEYTTLEIAPHAKALFETAEVDGVEKVEKEFISVLAK